jgi:hypothetical protein
MVKIQTVKVNWLHQTSKFMQNNWEKILAPGGVIAVIGAWLYRKLQERRKRIQKKQKSSRKSKNNTQSKTN